MTNVTKLTLKALELENNQPRMQQPEPQEQKQVAPQQAEQEVDTLLLTNVCFGCAKAFDTFAVLVNHVSKCKRWTSLVSTASMQPSIQPSGTELDVSLETSQLEPICCASIMLYILNHHLYKENILKMSFDCIETDRYLQDKRPLQNLLDLILNKFKDQYLNVNDTTVVWFDGDSNQLIHDPYKAKLKQKAVRCFFQCVQVVYQRHIHRMDMQLENRSNLSWDERFKMMTNRKYLKTKLSKYKYERFFHVPK